MRIMATMYISLPEASTRSRCRPRAHVLRIWVRSQPSAEERHSDAVNTSGRARRLLVLLQARRTYRSLDPSRPKMGSGASSR